MADTPLTDGEVKNLETITRAALNGDLGLTKARRRSDGREVTLLAAFASNGGEVDITPLAEMFGENPYELFDPPNPDGGYEEEREARGTFERDVPLDQLIREAREQDTRDLLSEH